MKIVKLKYKREHLYDSSSSSLLRLPFVFLSSSFSSFSVCPFPRPLTFLFENDMYMAVAERALNIDLFACRPVSELTGSPSGLYWLPTLMPGRGGLGPSGVRRVVGFRVGPPRRHNGEVHGVVANMVM